MTNTKAAAKTTEAPAVQAAILDAALGDPVGQQLAADILADKAAGAQRPARPMAQPELPPAADQGQAQAAARKPETPRELSRAALAGVTSGAKRRELHRPKYGQQTRHEVPINQGGRLADTITELVAGRSRRYAQDLEGWCRAALADGAQRGVLVIWDGMFYSIGLDAQVEPRTVLEVHRRDVASWRASVA